MVHRVYVYVFETTDGRRPEERLQQAVDEYCRECGIEEKRMTLYNENGMLDIMRTERGKPYFSNCPWIQFSISHSGAYWACVISNEQVGIDLQECVRAKGESEEDTTTRFYKMARRFFHPCEVNFVEQNIYINFFTVWTAKEAYVKFTGQGIDRNFSKYCMVPEKEAEWSGILQHTEEVRWKALDKFFWEKTIEEKYVLCVCTDMQSECRIIKCYESET